MFADTLNENFEFSVVEDDAKRACNRNKRLERPFNMNDRKDAVISRILRDVTEVEELLSLMNESGETFLIHHKRIAGR